MIRELKIAHSKWLLISDGETLTCPYGANTIYKGIAVRGHHDHETSPSNLPTFDNPNKRADPSIPLHQSLITQLPGMYTCTYITQSKEMVYIANLSVKKMAVKLEYLL